MIKRKHVDTKVGDLILNNLEKGDVVYTHVGEESVPYKILNKPKEDKDGVWEWKSLNMNTGQEGSNRFNPYYSKNFIPIFNT